MGAEATSEEQNNDAAAGPEIDAALHSVAARTGRLMVRNLGGLLAPLTVISVSLWMALLTGLMGLDGRAVIRDGAVQLVSPGPRPVVTLLLITVVLMAVHLIFVAAVADATVDALLDRPVSAGRSLRAALRRSGQVLVLFVVVGVAVVTVVVLAVVTSPARSLSVFVALTLPLVAAAACWLLLAVPIVVLYESGPFRALRRLWQITRYRRTLMVWHALMTMIVPPVAVGAVAGPLISSLPGIAESVAKTAISTVLGVLTAAWQGTAATVVTLNRRYPFSTRGRDARPDTLSLADLAGRREEASSPHKRRPRRAAALAVVLMAAPATVYGGYLYANPLNLPDITSRSFGVDEHANELILLGGDRPAVRAGMRSMLSPAIYVCADRDCHHLSSIKYPYDFPIKAAPLPDGSMAVFWTEQSDKRSWPLLLGRCAGEGDCPRDLQKELIVGKSDGPVIAFAIATSGPAVTAAILSSVGDRRGVLRVVRCADVSCTSLRTLATARVDMINYGLGSDADEQLVMALGAGGRPVVAYEDKDGAIILFNCHDANCRRSETKRLVGSSRHPRSADYGRTMGVEVAVPPDDRPVLLHRRGSDGTVQLLRCRTPDCAAVDRVEIAEPAVHPGHPFGSARRTWPPKALALDQDGLPLVATYDLAHRKVVLVACDVADCSRRRAVPLAATEYGHPPARLDMEVSPDGRPRILRAGIDLGDRISSQLLICRNVRCGASRG